MESMAWILANGAASEHGSFCSRTLSVAVWGPLVAPWWPSSSRQDAQGLSTETKFCAHVKERIAAPCADALTVRGDIGNIACRSAPLTSVAQWMSGLFGHADLTPSDLVAALVLTAAAQQQRRRLQIKNALGEKLDSITEASSDNNNPGAPAATFSDTFGNP